MNNNNEHNELDQFLREKFEGHTIEPAEELWAGIEPRFAQRVVPIRKYSRLKLALYSSAVIIAGLVVVLAVVKTQNPTVIKEEVSEFLNENATPENKPEIRVPEETPQKSIIAENKTTYTKTRKILIQSKERKITENDTEKKRQLNHHLAFLPLKPIINEDLRLYTDPNIENLKTKATLSIKTESKKVKNSTRSNRKKHRAIFQQKHKNFSAKKYYAQKAKHKNKNTSGNWLENFDLRANITPAYTTRLLNNQQNVSVVNYNPAFYNNIEKGRITLNGGLELAYNFNSNWSVYSGLKLSRYSQHIRTTKNQYEIVSDNQILIPSSAGNFGLSANGIGQMASESEVSSFLKLQYLDVPVVARYKLKRRFYFDAGIKLSYLLSDKIIVDDIESESKFQVEKIMGLQKNNFSIILGSGMEHTTKSGFRFEAGPEISLSLTNINPSANVIAKPVFLGFRTSIYFGNYKKL